jgi:diguanylate cyclase (GGDEF)-like protein/PAS domain S-box-containing protein
MSVLQWAWIFLALAIGAASCFSTTTILSRAATATGQMRRRWLLLAATVFGVGVWTTHFVAMVAEASLMEMGYSLALTVVSLVLAIAGSALGFALLLHGAPRIDRRLSAGLLVALAVASMHFTGMAAFRFDGNIIYRPGYVVVALALGVAFSVLAVRRVERIERLAVRLEMATFLVLGIAAIHFIAMAGTSFTEVMRPMAQGSSIVQGATLVAAGASLFAMGGIFAIDFFDQRWRRMRQEAARLRDLADSTIEGLLIHDQGRILWVNTALQRLLGVPIDALLGEDACTIATPETQPVLRRHLQSPGDSMGEIDVRQIDGTTRTAEILSRSIDYAGRAAMVIAVRDITERRQAEARMNHLAYHDPLTGLGNRLYFNNCLNSAIADATPLALLIIDLDRFKPVNDLYGHLVGDRLLTLVGARLAHTLRHEDIVVRLGGDEFAIMQMQPDQPSAAASLAERIVETLALPFVIDGQSVSIGASVGIAIYPQNAASFLDLQQASDLALGRAKQDGRNTFCFFEPSMDIRCRERRLMEQDLRQAIEREQLSVHYQPLVDCSTMEVVGYEALVRWQHQTQGSIPPSDFIPVAEESSLIMPLGRFVLAQACKAALAWPAHYLLAVNLSPVQFNSPHLAENIIEIIDSLGFPATRLELEITESVLIDNVERALVVLGKLKAHGIRIALDDFGTGYSSLSTLRRFPFDKLKIDRSFVQSLGEDAESDAIIRAILALGASLRLTVTAEGVENIAQLAALQAEGCTFVQGFLLGRPSAHPLRFPASLDHIAPDAAGIPAVPHRFLEQVSSTASNRSCRYSYSATSSSDVWSADSKGSGEGRG